MRGTTVAPSGDVGIRENRDLSASPPWILLVDDDPTFATVIRELLSDEFGACVVAEETAARAIARIGAGAPDLVLLDMLLKDGTAADVLRALCGVAHEIPVIVCTAATLAGTTGSELLELGAAAILPKPFDVDELLGLVRQHCRPRALAVAGQELL